MIEFASELAARIRASEGFWDDLRFMYSRGIAALLGGAVSVPNEPGDLTGISSRLTKAAYTFAQAPSESDKNLAQAIALYLSLASSDDANVEIATDILVDLGNFAGADRLKEQLGVSADSLTGIVRDSLLRSFNVLEVAGENFYLTDFQKRVWDNLTTDVSTAISAPTSAGKSFVVLEFLARRAAQSESFNAVYIAPTRALLTEISSKLSRKLERSSDSIRVSTIPTLDSKENRKQVFVLTQERLQVLLAITDFTFDLIIVDEAQAISDDSRGMILQDCLETIQSRRPGTRFLFLAPGATGFNALTKAVGISGLAVQRTEVSPVVQNRITVQPDASQKNKLHLALLSESRKIPLCAYQGSREFENQKTRLAAVALELGATGGSLVYGTGPADAEKVAGQIASGLPESESEHLRDLEKFVKEHVHPQYSLASHVRKGVAFHYGKMPSLLREAIEEAFKKNELRYLTCTTTLFQGVNLPARNVFIDTPTHGNKGEALDAASLWNFAGRAGRLGQDICGNVFLVDYDQWEGQPLNERRSFAIAPSFKSAVVDRYSEVIDRLVGENEPRPDSYGSPDAAAGLLLSRAARGNLNQFLNQTLADTLAETELSDLETAVNHAYEGLGLPAEIIATNWTVNPFGQARLLKRFREKITEGEFLELIPLHPTAGTAYKRYVSVFSRINKYILSNNASKFSNKLAATGLSWMRGKPLPLIIADTVAYKVKGETLGNVDSIVRSVFDFVEDTLRFKYVQLGRAYIDLLRFALLEAGHTASANSIYDFSLALELGVASSAGRAFIELGLSRTTAAELENLIPNSAPTADQARRWLAGLTGTEFPLSRMIWDELERKGLINSGTGNVTAPVT